MSLARYGLAVIWPLLLVAGLIVYNTVDADGDPLTANGPPIVLTSEVTTAVATDAGVTGAERAVVVGEGGVRRLRQRVSRWACRARSLWRPQARPIRGP